MQEIFDFWSFLRRRDVATVNVTITQLAVLNSTYLDLRARVKIVSRNEFLLCLPSRLNFTLWPIWRNDHLGSKVSLSYASAF